jgi:hypothetical protein
MPELIPSEEVVLPVLPLEERIELALLSLLSFFPICMRDPANADNITVQVRNLLTLSENAKLSSVLFAMLALLEALPSGEFKSQFSELKSQLEIFAEKNTPRKIALSVIKWSEE